MKKVTFFSKSYRFSQTCQYINEKKNNHQELNPGYPKGTRPEVSLVMLTICEPSFGLYINSLLVFFTTSEDVR